MFDIDYILVPVDFSRSSRAALSLAKNLADEQTRVEVVHVVDRWPSYMDGVLFPYAPLGEDAPEIEHELVEAARGAITSYHKLSGKNGVEGPVVAFGALKATLVEHGRSTAANLIVMGAFGETGARTDSIGSTSERMVRTAGCTTLLVREFEPNPTISRILVALDLTEGSRRVLGAALAIAQASGAELEIIHVIPDPLHDDQSQVLASMLKFDSRKVASRARDRVEALFDRLTRDLQPSFSDEKEVAHLIRRRKVTVGEPAAQIIGHAQKIGADLIVCGSRDPARSDSAYLGRIASTIARRSPTHVAVVPVPSVARLTDDG